MTGQCPQCGRQISVRSRRGSRISDHQCPDCAIPLRVITAGKSRGSYLCPITGDIVVLGLRGSVQLDSPYRLIYQAGPNWRGEHTTVPDDYEQYRLDRIAGRVLAPGCVVANLYSLTQPDPFTTDRCGLRLIPVTDNLGGADDWIINAPLWFRACAGCGRRTPVHPEFQPTTAWTPAHSATWKGRGRSRTLVDTRPGPHPAGSTACHECHPDPNHPINKKALI